MNLQAFEGEEHLSFREIDHQATTAALLVHGFPGTPAELRALGRSLRSAGLSVSCPLLPGFGREIATLGERSRAEWIAAVGESLGELRRHHQRVVLIGYSMGGAISLHLAGMADALVLLAPFWELGGSWQRIIWPVLRRFLSQIRPFAKADFSDPRLRRELLKFMPGADLDDPSVRQAVREISIPFRVIDELRNLGLSASRQAPNPIPPTLVIQGTADEVVKPHQTRRLVARMASPVDYHEVEGDHAIADPASAAWPRVEEMVVRFALGKTIDNSSIES